MTPEFSVVIPAYNQAQFIGETLQSVFRQTLRDFEIIVVNDASPDNTSDIVAQFADPRLQYIIHDVNKGLPAARNTGMRAAVGKYVALLDSDDLFHPQKLELHANYLRQHPEVGVTYNARFNFNFSDTTIRDITRPPLTVGLEEILHGYPFSPSDMVIRKTVIDTEGCFDDYYRNGGEDLEYPAMLALGGVKFAGIDRALNYRRYHSNRYRKNLDPRLKDLQDALAKIYSDPRCPEKFRALGAAPLTEHVIVLAFHAFMQNRTEIGCRFLQYLLEINPRVLDGVPCALVRTFAKTSSADEKEDHAATLNNLAAQLPELPVDILPQFAWAIQQGFLIKGVRASIWDREEDGKRYFQKAAELGGSFAGQFLQEMTQSLVNYEHEMGSQALTQALRRLLPEIERLCPPERYRAFLGELYARRAFQNYNQGKYREVPGNVLNAFWSDPAYMRNRGMFSIFTKSLVRKEDRA